MTTKEGGLRGSIRNVGVGVSAIPDSGGTHQYNTDAGSGTVLADSIGSLDGSINGPTWVSGDGAGGYYLDYDGADDETVLTGGASEFTHFTDGGTGTFFAWIRPDSLASASPIWGSTFTTSETGLVFVFQDGDLRCSIFYGSSGVETQAIASYPDSTGEWAPVAFTADGSTLRVYAGDPLTEITSASLASSSTDDWSNDPQFGHEPLADGRYDGGIDIPWTDSVQQTQSELQTFVDNSQGFYP